MFDCKVVCDSVSRATQKRLTTIVITYPRFIHAEILTHRDRARNSASSRAIPWPKMMAAIETNPVVPIRWGSEQKGMQAGDEIPAELQPLAKAIWLQARNNAVKAAKMLADIGELWFQMQHTIPNTRMEALELGALAAFFDEDVWNELITACPRLTTKHPIEERDNELKTAKVHKSLVNRITEPWMWITVVMTATEWQNFFRLRCHPDAEIHFQKIAGMIKHSLENSRPEPKEVWEWHLPFTTIEDFEHDIEIVKKCSVARCARVSYLTHEGKRDVAKDLELFERLVQGSGFGHMSPHEHVAQAWPELIRSGPFIGWSQFRKSFPNECADK